MIRNKSFMREIVITIGLIIIYRACLHVSIPFINEQAVDAIFNESRMISNMRPGGISIIALGIMPYISAYLLVELASLFIPFMKKLRKGDYTGRRKLKRYAFWLTVPLAVWQATGLIHGLSEFTTKEGIHILSLPNNTAYAATVLTLAAGVFLLIIFTEFISSYGIGNGISIIILSGISSGAALQIMGLGRFFDAVGIFPFLISFIFVFIMIFAAIKLFKTKAGVTITHSKLEHPVNFFQLNLCPSGDMAVSFGLFLIMIPSTIAYYFWDNFDPMSNYAPGSFFYSVILIILVCGFSYIFAWLLFHPGRRFDRMKQWGWEFHDDQKDTYDYLSRRMLVFNIPWTLLLCVSVILPDILIVKTNVPFYIGGTKLLLGTVICLDIAERFKTYSGSRKNRLVKIAEIHDVYDASMIKEHLKAEGISFHFQGYYHRHLLYFFGPYIDISLKVAAQDIEQAKNIIRTYYNGLCLV